MRREDGNGGETFIDALVDMMCRCTAIEVAQNIIDSVELFAKNNKLLDEKKIELYLMVIERLQKEIDRNNDGMVVSE